MKGRDRVLVLSGLCGLLLAIAGGFALARSSHFTGEARAAPAILSVERSALESSERSGAVEHHFSVRVVGPRAMRRDQTETVELVFDASSEGVGGVALEEPVTARVTLLSPAFDIQPAEQLERSGVPPLTYKWLVEPKSEGRRRLLLDVSGPLRRGEVEVLRDEVTLNGERLTVEDASLVEITVDVYTPWGISRRTFDVVRWLVAAIGFVLTYPLWIDWLRRRLGSASAS